ncbi:MAG: precorrin-6A/cobalt-precorrin-6A reductase [Planctomycetes bacterium]|nr:precorrin-6A/cobalt-precorrin-6A reductase [Planctomycetota bacterium]
MKRVLIFGGTADGRALAERLCSLPVDITVSVATDYGRDVLAALPDRVRVLTGRLDEAGMLELFNSDKPDWIIDATHPYAVAASLTVRRAAEAAGRETLRLYRPPGAVRHGSGPVNGRSVDSGRDATTPDACGDDEHAPADVRFFPDLAAAAADLARSEERVLLAIGVKGLGAFVGIENFAERLFPRVLPTVESIEECQRLGFKRGHIIAMQGPFSEALNRAILDQFNIGALVTKDGGAAGGLGEKLAAARTRRARVLLVGRPIGDGGLTLEELVGRIGRDVETA